MSTLLEWDVGPNSVFAQIQIYGDSKKASGDCKKQSQRLCLHLSSVVNFNVIPSFLGRGTTEICYVCLLQIHFFFFFL